MADERKPWALFVSLINPRDIMYFNTDEPGEHVQGHRQLLMHRASPGTGRLPTEVEHL